MTLASLLNDMSAHGVRLGLGNDPGRLRVDAPAGVMTPAMLAGLVCHKAELLAILGSRTTATTSTCRRAADVDRQHGAGPRAGTCVRTSAGRQGTVTISGTAFRYDRRWSGQRIAPVDGYLAFDTETDLVNLKQEIPRLALASASAGADANCLVHPDDIRRFILAHRDLHFVAHNSAFDFWVVEQHLRQRGEDEALQAWWEIVGQNRLHDSMILDSLLRLAKDDSYPEPRNLATVAIHLPAL
jgi:hypothetical protein